MDESGKALLLLKDCLVPGFSQGNNRPLIKQDFELCAPSITEKLSLAANCILDSNGTISKETLTNVDLLSHLVVVCGQHTMSGAWTEAKNVELCLGILDKIEVAYKNANGQDIFKNSKILTKIFVLLRSDLLPTNFKCHPASVICYSWVLKRLKLPDLADHLAETLPTALILADDYETENIKMGLECLHHIIENVAIAQLRYNGSDEVILDVLKKCMFQTETDVVTPQLDCYIALMKNGMTNSSYTLVRNNFDQPIKTILSNMYMEQKIALRLVYVSNLANLIEARGLGIVRHLTLIFKILHEYTLEPITTNKSLEALSKIVQVCWCRGESVKENVTLILLKLCVELSRNNGKYEVDEVLRLSRITATLLIEAFPKLTDELDKYVCASDSIDKSLETVIRQIFQSQN